MVNTKRSHKGGYTLIELAVVMGIIFLVAGISLVNYDRFGREVELENAAYDIALTIRTAQFFGINRKDGFAGSTAFSDPKPYGIYFNASNTVPVLGVNQESFMMFVDQEGGVSNTDNLFNNTDPGVGPTPICTGNNSQECVDIFTLFKGNYISGICAGASEATCDDIGDILHITFKRPNPDATIKDNSGNSYSYAEVTVSSPVSQISDKKISVGVAGQISIK